MINADELLKLIDALRRVDKGIFEGMGEVAHHVDKTYESIINAIEFMRKYGGEYDIEL